MQPYKIVITGAYAAGKTHFIRTISDIEALSTEYAVTDAEERQIKSSTTVALDFGKIAINEEIMLYLFGTPGQQRFDFMWEHLGRGALGYVVMVDSTRPAHFAETRHLMSHFAKITPSPFVVAANKQDDPTALPLDYIHEQLRLPAHVPVLPCIAIDRESVKSVLLALLERISQHAEA